MRCDVQLNAVPPEASQTQSVSEISSGTLLSALVSQSPYLKAT